MGDVDDVLVHHRSELFYSGDARSIANRSALQRTADFSFFCSLAAWIATLRAGGVGGVEPSRLVLVLGPNWYLLLRFDVAFSFCNHILSMVCRCARDLSVGEGKAARTSQTVRSNQVRAADKIVGGRSFMDEQVRNADAKRQAAETQLIHLCLLALNSLLVRHTHKRPEL